MLVRLFSIPTLFRDPWGGLSLVPLITILFRFVLLTFVDSLIAGVRKHGKHLKVIFIFTKVQTKTNKYLGGINGNTTKTQHIHI